MCWAKVVHDVRISSIVCRRFSSQKMVSIDKASFEAHCARLASWRQSFDTFSALSRRDGVEELDHSAKLPL